MKMKKQKSLLEKAVSLPTFVWIIIILLLSGVTVTLNTVLHVGCLAKAIFGVPCPVCGMTRAFLSLLKLDFAAAISYNPAFWTFPLICISGILAATDKKRTKLWLILFSAFIATLLIFWAVRLALGTVV